MNTSSGSTLSFDDLPIYAETIGFFAAVVYPGRIWHCIGYSQMPRGFTCRLRTTLMNRFHGPLRIRSESFDRVTSQKNESGDSCTLSCTLTAKPHSQQPVYQRGKPRYEAE